MYIDPAAAVKAVQTVVESAAAGGPAATAGDGFAGVLNSVAQQALQALPVAEAAAQKGVEGAMPAQKVVMAILEAERSLQTVIAVRDKVVAAYQEISRMSI